MLSGTWVLPGSPLVTTASLQSCYWTENHFQDCWLDEIPAATASEFHPPSSEGTRTNTKGSTNWWKSFKIRADELSDIRQLDKQGDRFTCFFAATGQLCIWLGWWVEFWEDTPSISCRQTVNTSPKISHKRCHLQTQHLLVGLHEGVYNTWAEMQPNEVIACLRERLSARKWRSGVSSGVILREDNLHIQKE